MHEGLNATTPVIEFASEGSLIANEYMGRCSSMQPAVNVSVCAEGLNGMCRSNGHGIGEYTGREYGNGNGNVSSPRVGADNGVSLPNWWRSRFVAPRMREIC